MAKAGDILLTQDPTNFISELIMAGSQGSFSHSAIVSEVDEQGNIKIIEAMPNGVEENKLHYERYAIYEIIDATDEQREKIVSYAKSCLGEGYDYLQDVGFAINGIRGIIGLGRIPKLLDEQGKIVCSALVDLAIRNAGIILRTDRYAGDITPTGISFSDKVRLIENHNLWEL